jgi:hypothetical protein
MDIVVDNVILGFIAGILVVIAMKVVEISRKL